MVRTVSAGSTSSTCAQRHITYRSQQFTHITNRNRSHLPEPSHANRHIVSDHASIMDGIHQTSHSMMTVMTTVAIPGMGKGLMGR